MLVYNRKASIVVDHFATRLTIEIIKISEMGGDMKKCSLGFNRSSGNHKTKAYLISRRFQLSKSTFYNNDRD